MSDTAIVQGPLTIQGAILETSDAARPYAESRPIRIAAVELAPPGPGEILVKVEAASLCHSDLSVINGDRRRPLPMLLGHESAGRVMALGERVDDIAVGQRVVLTFLPRCGECDACRTDGRVPCSNGSRANGAGTLLDGDVRLSECGHGVWHHLGVSAFADHLVCHRSSAVPVGDDVPPDVAALFGCAVLTGGGALLNEARPGERDSVAVIGLGGVGMAALLTARALGAGRVIGIDALPDKLDRAIGFGADEAYTPEQALAAGIRASIVIEAAGHPRAFETAFAITAAGGTTVTVGLPAPDARSEIAPLLVTAESRRIVGSYLGSAVPSRDIPLLEALWRDGRLPVERLISRHIALADINHAFDALADGDQLRQVILFDM
ncbi:alcohol dehydrogenase [Sphingobium sp. 22B]|uniref:alcohol dehydrogenase catalytic domain-containing protein n=1 Tax=unclassified Sphingobium TaxID=2611147 RepID=UPI00078500D5|nr:MULTISPECIES: alcohol dehydrogenase catalytic domain-containing protein [unclassified Sphingobium]KXU30504.1 alcohol dehydrogenase [Sphingobium sp. AM]KYC30763.1 alcohol dehydrogenase [Sphingobium sp. 22B]OAP30060.1 alcohol dehydrogenase [Sphingobium sp. 20006FA]